MNGAPGQVPKETLTGCVGEAKMTTGTTVCVLNNTESGSTAMYVLGASPRFRSRFFRWRRSWLLQAEAMKVVAETCK